MSEPEKPIPLLPQPKHPSIEEHLYLKHFRRVPGTMHEGKLDLGGTIALSPARLRKRMSSAFFAALVSGVRGGFVERRSKNRSWSPERRIPDAVNTFYYDVSRDPHFMQSARYRNLARFIAVPRKTSRAETAKRLEKVPALLRELIAESEARTKLFIDTRQRLGGLLLVETPFALKHLKQACERGSALRSDPRFKVLFE